MMEVITHEKREDIEALMSENLLGSDQIKRMRRNMAIMASAIFITGIFVLVFFSLADFDLFRNPILLTMIIVMLGYPIYMVFKYFVFFENFRRKISSNTLKGKNVGSYLGRNRIWIDEVGVHRSNMFREEHYVWEGLVKIVNAEEYIFVFDTDLSATIVPKRDFRSKEQIQKFLAKIDEYRRS